MATDVLTINGGSSSIKFALYAPGDPPRALLSGKVEHVGFGQGQLSANGEAIGAPVRQPHAASDQNQAVEGLIAWLEQRVGLGRVAGVGHRVVHGGARYTEAQAITPAMIEDLKRIGPLDPDHMPQEVELIETLLGRLPRVPQVACFDTAFHRDLPRVARLLPVPRRLEAAGVRRYGFHGLSYAYLMEELARVAGAEAARGRIVLAHLGSGASMAAVRVGKCVDTTMAFTPTAGLVMATRSGDLDPGVLIYLMRTEQMDARQIDDLVNRRSGLLGISETSPDMRELLDRQTTDPRAAHAVALFCYQAKKWLGAFAAALGGLETLIFAGGIGENAAEVRWRICEGLEFLGLSLDRDRNAASADVISAGSSRVVVRVIRTNEELMIARTVFRLLESRSA